MPGGVHAAQVARVQRGLHQLLRAPLHAHRRRPLCTPNETQDSQTPVSGGHETLSACPGSPSAATEPHAASTIGQGHGCTASQGRYRGAITAMNCAHALMLPATQRSKELRNTGDLARHTATQAAHKIFALPNPLPYHGGPRTGRRGANCSPTPLIFPRSCPNYFFRLYGGALEVVKSSQYKGCFLE